MRLSIVIPVYQVEQYVADCLSSVLDSSSTDYEVIIVNDGSKDASMEIVNSMASAHSCIRVINQQNQGLSAARMNGLEAAIGDFVWFIDSDDYLMPASVDRVLAILAEKPDLDAVAFPLLWRYDDGSGSRTDYSLPEPRVYSGKDVLKNAIIPVWAAPRFIIGRKLFRSGDLYFPNGLTHEDDYFGRVLLYSAERVYAANEPVYVYRQREGSITHLSGVRSAEHILRIHELLIRFSESKVSEEDKGWFIRSALGLIRCGFTRNESILSTPEFRAFRKKNLCFILKQYKRFGSSLSRKEFLSDLSLYLFPVLHIRLYYLLHGRGIKK